MAINLNMFRMFVKDGVAGNMNGSLITIKERNWKSNRNMKFVKSCWIQTISLIVAASARYSTSANERKIVVYLLDFQDTNESPRNTQNPITDHRELRHEAQSDQRKLEYVNQT